MYQLTAADAAELESAASDLEQSRPAAALLIRRLVRAATGARRDYVTTGTAARFFGVTEQTVRNWIDRGWLPARRLRPLGRRQIPVEALRAVEQFRASRDALVKVRMDEAEAAAVLRADREEAAAAEVGGRS